MRTARRARSSSYLGNNSHVNIFLILPIIVECSISVLFRERCSVSVSSVLVLLRFDMIL
jgi:hypothetical protein